MFLQMLNVYSFIEKQQKHRKYSRQSADSRHTTNAKKANQGNKEKGTFIKTAQSDVLEREEKRIKKLYCVSK